MELQFNKNGNYYIAEFSVAGDFNIHIEKSRGEVWVEQKTIPDGRFDSANSINIPTADEVLDFDIPVLVAPKYIRIKSEVLPTKAVVTFPADVQAAIDESIVANLNTPV